MTVIALGLSPSVVSAQGGPGRGAAAPGAAPLTAAQTAALGAMDQAVATQNTAATAARAAFATATYAQPKNDADLRDKNTILGAAELALANARADQFAQVQASTNKLAADQIAAFVATGGRAGRAGGGGGRGGANLDAGITFTRPTDSPGLGTKLAELPKPDAEGFIRDVQRQGLDRLGCASQFLVDQGRGN